LKNVQIKKAKKERKGKLKKKNQRNQKPETRKSGKHEIVTKIQSKSPKTKSEPSKTSPKPVKNQHLSSPAGPGPLQNVASFSALTGAEYDLPAISTFDVFKFKRRST
jgi:hypothetical protein